MGDTNGGVVYQQLQLSLTKLNTYFEQQHFPATAVASVLADGGIIIAAMYMPDPDVLYPVAWMPRFSGAAISVLVQDVQSVCRDMRPIEDVLDDRMSKLQAEAIKVAQENPALAEFQARQQN